MCGDAPKDGTIANMCTNANCGSVHIEYERVKKFGRKSAINCFVFFGTPGTLRCLQQSNNVFSC